LIGSLTGRLVEKTTGEILVETGGVGYRVAIPLTTYGRLPAIGDGVTLRIHTHVREDAIALYGFDTRIERDLFEKLIGVPGIGPRLAMAVLSHLAPGELAQAARDRDTARLTRVPGIGSKTAERLVLELGGLLKSMPELAGAGAKAIAHGGRRADLFSALENLGYRSGQVAPAVEQALARAGEGDSFAALLRDALRLLAPPARDGRGAEIESIQSGSPEHAAPTVARPFTRRSR